MSSTLQKSFESIDWDGQVEFDSSLARHTYFKIGGPAEVLISPRSVKDLVRLREIIREHPPAPFYFLGAGSNVLIPDAGLPGIVLKTKNLNTSIFQDADGLVVTGGGVMITSLLRKAVEQSWGGLIFLAGVPGTVGGAVVMNAGTHLGESSGRLQSVEVFDFDSDQELTIYSAEDMKFEYRSHLFLPKRALVWSASWKVDTSTSDAVKAELMEVLDRRKSSQPVNQPCCGSVFKNPLAYGKKAWQVIDELGLRGHRIGDAEFSNKHCNFIINLGNATAADVLALIELAKSRAREELGIEMHPEVKIY